MTLSKLAVCLNRAIAPKILAQTFRRDAIYYWLSWVYGDKVGLLELA